MKYKSRDLSPTNDYGGRRNSTIELSKLGRSDALSCLEKLLAILLHRPCRRSVISYSSIELRCKVWTSDNARDFLLSSVKICVVLEVLPSSPSSPGDSIVIGGSACSELGRRGRKRYCPVVHLHSSIRVIHNGDLPILSRFSELDPALTICILIPSRNVHRTMLTP